MSEPTKPPIAIDTRPVGMKFDDNKPRWDLLPESLENVVAVLTYGAKKYSRPGECNCGAQALEHTKTCNSHTIIDGANDWRHVKGARWRYHRAALGHIWKWWRGQRLDEESGLSHLAHAACCVLFLDVFDMEE